MSQESVAGESIAEFALGPLDGNPGRESVTRESIAEIALKSPGRQPYNLPYPIFKRERCVYLISFRKMA